MEDEVDDGKTNEGSSSMATVHDQENTCPKAQKKDSHEESDSQTELDIQEEMESDDEKNQDSVPHSKVTESQIELQSPVEVSDSGSSDCLRKLFRSSSSENGYSEEGYVPDYDTVSQSQESPGERGLFRVEENVGESSRVSRFLRRFFSTSSSDDGSISSEDGYGPDQEPFKQDIERIVTEKWSSVLDKCFKEDFQHACDNQLRFARRLRRGHIPLEYFLREPQGTCQAQEEYDKNKKGFLEKIVSLMELRIHGRQSENEIEGMEMTELLKPEIVVDGIEEYVHYVHEQVSYSSSSSSSDTDEWRFPRSSLLAESDDESVHYAQHYRTFYAASDENTFRMPHSDGSWTDEDRGY